MNKLTLTECYIEGKKSKIDSRYNPDGNFRVLECHVSEMSQFRDGFNKRNQDFTTSEWQTIRNSKYFPNTTIKDNPSARKACENFVLPEELKQEAKVLSRQLVQSLTKNGGTPRILKHQTSGTFDSSKMRRIVTDLQKGTFSAENTLPFKRREKLAPSRPHVGIAFDGSWYQMWQDSKYIPRAAALSLGVAWACEAVGCPVTAAITRENLAVNSYGMYDMSSNLIISPEYKVRTSDLACIFDSELYRIGTCTPWMSSAENVMFKFKNKYKTPSDIPQDKHFFSDRAGDGGAGVEYLKAKGATITVAVGSMHDEDKADIRLNTSTTLKSAVEKIALMLADQNKKYGIAA